MWTTQCIKEDIKASAALIKQRGTEGPFATQMVNAIMNKIKGMDPPGPADLVDLFQSVAASSFSEEQKDDMNKALEEIAVGISSAAKIQMVSQQMDHVCNYLTESDWAKVFEESMWQGTTTIAARLTKVGLIAPNEKTKKLITAILVAVTMQKAKERPPYQTIYDLSKQVVLDFQCLKLDLPPSVPLLAKFPLRPTSLSKEAYENAYGEEKPVTKVFPNLAQLIRGHTPVRSTSALLALDKPSSKRESSAGSADQGMQQQIGTINAGVPSGALAGVPSGVVGALFMDWMAKSSQVLQVPMPAQPGNCNLQLLPSPLQNMVPLNGAAMVPYQAPGRGESFDSGTRTPSMGDKKQGSTDDLGHEASLEDEEEKAYQMLKAKEDAKKQKAKDQKDTKEPKKQNHSKKQAEPKPKKKPASSKAVAKPKFVKKEPKEDTKEKNKPGLPGGCIRCRGNPNGCSSCRKVGFGGKRFQNHAAWRQWANLNGKK